MNGGYIMIDATGLDLAVSTAQTIAGIYARFTAAITTGKPIMLCNAVSGSTPITPAYIDGGEVSGNYVFSLGTATLTITSSDAITVS